MGLIVDSFMLSNELDILELRLNILGDYVDRFVIVESDHTFTNIPKKYNFEDNADRFAKWHDKIQYIKSKSPCHSDPWLNENWSRDQIGKGWVDLSDKDIILFSDVDEIFRPEAIEFVKNTNFNFYAMIMPVSYYKFNYVDVMSDKISYVAWGLAFRGFHKHLGHQMRKHHTYVPFAYLHHAGWHFSWMGNTDHILNKLAGFSHTECNTDQTRFILSNVDQLIKNNVDHIDLKREKYRVVKLDNYFPKYLVDNQDFYSNYILPTDDSNNSVQDYYNFKVLQIHDSKAP